MFVAFFDVFIYTKVNIIDEKMQNKRYLFKTDVQNRQKNL